MGIKLSNSTGNVVAFNSAADASKINLVNSNGLLVSETVVERPSVTSILRLGWAGPKILWFEGHGGSHGSVFEFWRLPTDFNLERRKVLKEADGLDCVLSPNALDVACIQEDGLSINDDFVYPKDLLKEGEEVGMFEIGLHSPVFINTVPKFQIEVISISAKPGIPKTLGLRVVKPDGLWSEFYLKEGDIFPIKDGEFVYGFSSISLDEKKDQVMIRILRVGEKKRENEGGLSWDLTGQSLAFVEKTGDRRSLIVLKHVEERNGGQWQILKKPFSSAIERIKAIKPAPNGGALRLESENKLYIFEVKNNAILEPKVTDKITNTETLPVQLKINWENKMLDVDVFGWHCL